MKSLKDRISENQDFYNGVAVGILIGSTGLLFLIKGSVPPITVKWERDIS